MIVAIDASRANTDQPTGVEQYALQTIQELKTILPETISVVLYSRESLRGKLAELPPNWTSKVLHWPPKRFWTQIRLSFEMLVNRPDVLFVPAHVFPIVRPQKTVMTVHDIAAHRFPESYNLFERWYSLWSARYAAHTLWKIITPSEFTKQELVDVFHADPEKIFVTPLGVDPAYKNHIETSHTHELLQKYHITKPFIMSLGRLEEKKNTSAIINAFDIVKKKHDIQLVLAGKQGYGYDKIKDRIRLSPYASDIIETGWIEQQEAVALLDNAHIFVFPSLYEGFGLPVLEAFSCGVAVVASRGNSLEEIGEGAAIYVSAHDSDELAESIQKLLTDRELRAQLIELGYKRVKNYTWKKTAELTARIVLSD